MTDKTNINEITKGKRIVCIDYGKKRTGFAVCDELHISITPKITLITDAPDFWEKMFDLFKAERAGALVIGVPWRHDDEETDWIKEVKAFINKVETATGMTVFPYDEAFSSKRAVSTMVAIGKKKKKRSKKGATDTIAAAIILRDFLNENES
ncbi:MAG: Holliday junction resolvase RuvX [Candidatus Kapabacteria bacterium]|jgi:putative Holliday junction resolvase|nr:Holliday junction resolvase RuvX [Candidatus Kapabacteria bacterium]